MEKNVYGSEMATDRPAPWPWSSTLSAITLILENTSDPAILMEIDAYLGSNDPRDGQALLDYITAKGVTLPALQSNSHLPDNVIHGNAVAVVTRQYERYHTPECRANTEYSMHRGVLERLLAFVKVNAAPVEIEPAPRYNVTDALIEVSIPLPEYVRKTALELFDQNLLHGCELIAQYMDISAGMNLSEEQTEILTKKLRRKYTGPAWPKCYDRTMLVDGAGSVYDQALMLAVCGTVAEVGGLQLLRENGHVISRALEFIENPVCRTSVLLLVRVPNATVGEFNY